MSTRLAGSFQQSATAADQNDFVGLDEEYPAGPPSDDGNQNRSQYPHHGSLSVDPDTGSDAAGSDPTAAVVAAGLFFGDEFSGSLELLERFDSSLSIVFGCGT